MNRRNVLWRILVVLLAASVMLTAWLAHRHSELLTALEKRSGGGADATGQLGGQMQSAKQAGYQELGELREKLEESRTAVQRLAEKKGIQQKQLASAEALYYPPEGPSLEEFRETQPEEYEAMKKSLAHLLRFAAAKKHLREEYLARLDLSVLTDEERQTLLAVMKQVAEEEDMLLEGKIGPGLYYQNGRRSYNQLQRWLREGHAVDLAMAADWASFGGSEHFVTLQRALALKDQCPMGVQPESPQALRGTNNIMIADPDAPEGKRPISVKVEPGWQPE